jgi:hypothetical protein
MKQIQHLSSYVKSEFTDDEAIVLNMTKYDMFVFLFSFFFTLEVGIVIIFKGM